MGTLLLVDAPGLSGLLTQRGSHVSSIETSLGMKQAFSASESVDALVVGPRIVDPIQTAQRAYRFDASVAVVLLCEGEQCLSLRDAVRFSPFVGTDVVCSDAQDAQLATAIEQAAERTRVRRKHRATVAALQTQLRPSQPRPPSIDRELFAMQLLDVAPIGIVCLDNERRIASVNLEASRLLGITEREVIGQHLDVVASELSAWDKLLTRSTGERATATFEYSHAAKVFIEAAAVALAGNDGFIVTLQDVTERRRAAEARETALLNAEEANRLKDEFVAMISHELRTPLNAVVGWTRLLRSGTLPADKMPHALEVIERNADAQVRLVEDLLDLSRIVAGKMRLEVQTVNLGHVLRQSAEAVRVAAEAKQLSLLIEVEPSLPELNADRERLQQVFWNLLSNSVKFTPRNGTVRARAYQSGSTIRIEVSDDGEGIRPEALAYVFDPFRQAEGGTTRAHGGLGLGLAVVRRLVELHGGRVTADSAGVGHGATFVVEMPVSPLQLRATVDECVVGASRNALTAESETVNLRAAIVLVVDDEPDACELIAMLVTAAGGRAHTAASSAEGIALLEREPIQLVVSDIGMPDEDGYAFVRSVRGLHGPKSRVPIIALTAYAREQERARALAAGFDAHLSKPIAPELLLELIVALLGPDSK